MAAMLKPSAEYIRAIIEGLHARRSAIIRFFSYPRSTIYDVVAKYLKQSNEGSSMPAKKSHSKERIARTPAIIERIKR